jgi:hypothetical protein
MRTDWVIKAVKDLVPTSKGKILATRLHESSVSSTSAHKGQQPYPAYLEQFQNVVDSDLTVAVGFQSGNDQES